MKSKSKELIAIDLFAGAGGFSLAATDLNIRILAAVEHDKWAQETYTLNFIKHKRKYRPRLYGDITELKPEDIMAETDLRRGQLDILMGGPPCQGFSTHRINNAGVDDPRNELLLHYFRFVKALLPKTFIVENVPGLLWQRHQDYLNRFTDMVSESGYILYGPQILDAKDYGVPQNRKRVFMVGVHKSIKSIFEWPEPTHFAPNTTEVKKNGLPAWHSAKTVFNQPLEASDANAVHMQHSKELIEVFRSTPLNGGSRRDSNRMLPCHRKHNGHKDTYGRIDPAKPGPTMTTACINPSKGRFVHPVKHHGITVRHAARFQTFPDNFVFQGGLMAAGKQVGNAVPIELGKNVLAAAVRALKQNGQEQ